MIDIDSWSRLYFDAKRSGPLTTPQRGDRKPPAPTGIARGYSKEADDAALVSKAQELAAEACQHQAEGQHSRGGPFFAIKSVRSARIPRSG
ncbi:MAG TPA: hypothetical protein VIX59_20950 [Candidatus Binataceae bacterium]